MTKDEALRLALEALEMSDICADDCKCTRKRAINGIKAALETKDEPEGWKLVPIEPTNKMLKAMDECSIEGYDERLYAGYAASVYMAAVDVAPSPSQQHAKDLAKLGWQYFECPACGSEGARAFPKPEANNELVAIVVDAYDTPGLQWLCQHPPNRGDRLYITPSQRKPLTDEEIVLIVAECAASHQHTDIHFARAIEAKLRSKNHD